jgi:hypothetical protein
MELSIGTGFLVSNGVVPRKRRSRTALSACRSAKITEATDSLPGLSINLDHPGG